MLTLSQRKVGKRATKSVMGLQTSRKPTGESPFSLTYRMEAIIPIEIGMPTIQIDIPNKANVEATTKGLDTTDELREAVVVRIASYQQRLENLHNRWVKRNTFKAGELVLRRVFENTANPSDEKFQANLEGPYIVVQVGTVGSYALRKLDGTVVPGCGTPCILRSIINSVFFEEIIINKILSFTHFLLKPTVASF